MGLLFFAICFQVLHKTAYMIYFDLNRTFIIENQCVNAKVMPLQCKAKCQLNANMLNDQSPMSDRSFKDFVSASDFEFYFFDL